MNFFVDAQLPPALALWLTRQGHQAAHVSEIGLRTAADPVIWERARNESGVIITKDEDFVDRWILSENPVGLVWIRKGNCSNRALMAWLEPELPAKIRALGEGIDCNFVPGGYQPASRLCLQARIRLASRRFSI